MPVATRVSSPSSSFNRIPPEIWGNEIFKHCLPDHIQDFTESPPPSNCREAPLLLCNVCHDWREIAISTSNLWTRISVALEDVEEYCSDPGEYSDSEDDPRGDSDSEDFDDSVDVPLKRTLTPSLETVSLWLERSASQPLWLSLRDWTVPNEEEDGEDGKNAMCNSVLELFVTQVYRWHTIRFELHLPVRFGEHHRPFPVALNSEFIPEYGSPLLEVARIVLANASDSSEDAQIGSAFSRILTSARSLRHLDWLPEYRILQALPMHWDDLTNISISSEMSIADIGHVIHACRYLKTFQAVPRLSAHSQNSLDSLPHITARHLRSFHVVTKVDLGNLFDKLTLPNLETFDVMSRGTPWAGSQLQALIVRSRCSLLCLRLLYTDIPEDDLIALLQSSPTVMRLELTNLGLVTRFTDRLITMLTVKRPDSRRKGRTNVNGSASSNGNYLGPNLASIRWSGILIDSKSGTLSKMVASRLSQPAPLQSFHLSLHRQQPQDRFKTDRVRLDDLKAKGLDVRVNVLQTALKSSRW